jgi:drug/metabolite transporter (DMT)-like permease
MEWFGLSLLCALSTASADAVTKKYLSDYRVEELVVVRFAVSGLLLSPLLCMAPLPPLPLPFWGWIALLVPLEFAAMGLYLQAIRDSPLALTLPYLSFTPVFVTLTGFLILGEQVTLQGLTGILLVVAGTYLLNLQAAVQVGGGWTWTAPLRALWREPGSLRMLGAAVIYSLTSVLGKGALQYVSPAFFGPFYFCLLGCVAVLAFASSTPGLAGVLVRRPAAHLALAVCMAVMVITHYAAIAQVEVAYMIAVKRTSLLFGIAYGALLFGEQRLLRNLVAGALMLAGVTLIVL